MNKKKAKFSKKRIWAPQKIPLVFLLLLAFTTYVKYGHLNIYSFDHLLIFLPTDTVENIKKEEKNFVHVLTEIFHQRSK